MGNIMHESRFSPTNAHDKAYDGMFDEIDDTNYDFDQYPKAAYGLMQWKFQARRDNLKAVATSMGLAVGDINAQFAAIRAESEDTNYTYNGWMTLRNMSSVSSATQVFKNQIEGCDDNSLSDRQAFASAIYSALI